MELGTPELIIILLLVLLLFGPGRLSKIGGELGQGIHAFRKGLSTDDHAKSVSNPNPENADDAIIPQTALPQKDEEESKIQSSR